MKTRDVVTAASVIADRHTVGLKVEDIKEAMVSAMLEYADLRERKQANGAEQSSSNCNIPLVSNRRELLSNFANWYNNYYDFDFTIDDGDIDEFLKIAL